MTTVTGDSHVTKHGPITRRLAIRLVYGEGKKAKSGRNKTNEELTKILLDMHNMECEVVDE